MTPEVEEAEQIVDGRAVVGDKRVVRIGYGIGKVVAAAVSDSAETPIAFDKFENGDMVAIVVGNMATTAVGGYHDQWDARAITEEIEVLDIAGVIVTAAFIDSDEDRSALPEFLVALNGVDDFLDEALEQVKFGRGRMAVNPTAWLNERNGGQGAILDVGVKIKRVHDVGGANGIVGHNLCLVLKRVADVAVLVALCANGSIVELVLVAKIRVPLIVVGLPGNVVFQKNVGDAVLTRWRNCERGVVDEVVRVSVGAIAKVAGIVVVQEIVVARIAIGVHRAGE